MHGRVGGGGAETVAAGGHPGLHLQVPWESSMTDSEAGRREQRSGSFDVAEKPARQMAVRSVVALYRHFAQPEPAPPSEPE